MSSIYVLEPPTKGKVILYTTLGPLDIELWPKEAPKAVRNFVQLCMEGYYDGTIFHRIIKSFIIQGGDPTGSGTGGESIYGYSFADEFHSRLRFTHRGLVASAHGGTPNSNNSQFFITLDRCDFLDKKHTIFGKVTGETVYNLLKLGELVTDKDDRPLEPPKILSVEILWNPFEDIIPRELAKKMDAQAEAVEKTEKKDKKAEKKLNLLSFGEEAFQEEQELVTIKTKIKSSHDVLNDPRLLKVEPDAAEMEEAETKRRKELQSAVRQALGAGKVDATEQPSDEDGEDDGNFDARMRRQVLEKKRRLDQSNQAESTGRRSKNVARNEQQKESDSRKADQSSRPQEDSDLEEDSRPKKDRLVIRKKGLGSEARAELAAKADLDAQLMSPLEQQRQKYKQKKRLLRGREEATLALLNKFKSKVMEVKTAPVKTKDAMPAEMDKTDEDTSGWLSHSLMFPVDEKKKDMDKNDDPNQYVVLDPLLEKGKEKFNKVQARMKRRNREWAGKSLD